MPRARGTWRDDLAASVLKLAMTVPAVGCILAIALAMYIVGFDDLVASYVGINEATARAIDAGKSVTLTGHWMGVVGFGLGLLPLPLVFALVRREKGVPMSRPAEPPEPVGTP